MSSTSSPPLPENSPDLPQFPITVLLIDDQAIIGQAVRQMLEGEPDITLYFCQDPTKALEMAGETQPTVILQDLVMPDVDGLTLVKFFRASPATKETPLIVLSSKEEPIVKAEAFALGANDYLVKLPDKIELIARIRHHSKGYISLLERNEAYEAIARSRQRLQDEIQAAVKYVRKLLPAPITEPVATDSRYIPSTDLGGDTFGYHGIDDDHFALYLIDVSGHGLDSALLSVTVMSVLRSRALPETDFRDPGQVLAALNQAFPMEEYGDKFFTIWYGVFDRSRSTLVWSGAGHPPALLFEGDGSDAAPPARLDSDGPMIGAFPDVEFAAGRQEISPGARLYIYSDGVQEIHKTDGGDWMFEEFVEFMSQPGDPSVSLLDRLYRHVCDLHGSELLDDDFSIVEIRF